MSAYAECSESECGYGECSGRMLDNGMCETHGNGEGRCQQRIRPVETVELPEVETLYIVCKGCGEAFDDLRPAHEHGVSDPNSKSWCGEDGFDLMTESEAM